MSPTLQLARKKCLAKSCLEVQEKRFWREIIAFFAAVLSEMDLGNVERREA